MPALPDDTVRERLTTLPGWELVGEEIVKTYQFASFPDAISFVGRVAELAEDANHHPDIDIRYNRVRVALTTHDEGGITDLDFALAAESERVSEA